jgi:hypothetical protein
MKIVKTKLALTLAVSILTVVSTQSFAETKKAGTGPNPYRDCGIGAALFPDTNWAAVSSNVIWDVGTTAVTSATMSADTCNGNEVVAAEFILNTYDNLIEETAQGQGEHLATILNIYGCNTDQQPMIVNDIRTKAAADISSEAFAELNDVEKASRLYENIQSTVSNEFSAHCAV